MKALAIVLALILVTPAFAQGVPMPVVGPPSDQEIDAAHAICNDPAVPKRVGIGIVGNRPADAGQYKPEWKQCETIDAEHEKRGIAAKAKQDADQKKIDSIIQRMPK